MLAISLKQPWAWLMTIGPKRIENRKWATRYRGPILVHASLRWDRVNFPLYGPHSDQFHFPQIVDEATRLSMPRLVSDYLTGGIVGMFTITDCVSQSNDPWFFGPKGFVVKDARPLPFVRFPGKLNLFPVPDEIVTQTGLDLLEIKAIQAQIEQESALQLRL